MSRCCDADNANICPIPVEMPVVPPLASSTSIAVSPRIGVCHVETLTVALKPVEDGYGLQVNTDTNSISDQQQANIVITSIELDSPAYRCGGLQTGDRIISINGQCSLTVQEIQALLDLGHSPDNSSSTKLLLQTEFDVADTVIPSSGIFTVKLAKSGPDLGITVTGRYLHLSEMGKFLKKYRYVFFLQLQSSSSIT